MSPKVQLESLKCFHELLERHKENLSLMIEVNDETMKLVDELTKTLISLAEEYSTHCKAELTQQLLKTVSEFFAKEAANYGYELTQILCNLFSDDNPLLIECQYSILNLLTTCSRNHWGSSLFYVDLQCIAIWDKIKEIANIQQVPYNNQIACTNYINILLD